MPLPLPSPEPVSQGPDTIADAVTWATVTVFVWFVVLSLGVLLLRLATKRPPVWEDEPTTERDEPIRDGGVTPRHHDAP